MEENKKETPAATEVERNPTQRRCYKSGRLIMTDQLLLQQLWQALKEAKTPYDHAIIFNYFIKKGD